MRRLIICALLLFVACAGNDSSPVEPGDAGTGPVTRTITPSGGVVTASTAGGTSVTLTFPAEAVRVDTDVTLRPDTQEDAAFFSMLLEPAGMVFLKEVVVSVAAADNVALTDQILFFGDPGNPMLLPTTVDTGARTVSASIRSFGLPEGGVSLAASASAQQNHPGNNLGGMQQNCQQILTRAQTCFDNFVAQGDFEEALRSALSSAALLQRSGCSAAIQQWLDTVATLSCTSFETAITNANQATITGIGDFETYAQPIVNWAGIAAHLSPLCSANFDYLDALDGLISRFLVWYTQQLSTLSGPNLQVYSDLKQELVQLNTLITQALSLGLSDGAVRIENNAIFPTLQQMREAAYGLGKDDHWHYALTKLTTAGFFAGRDIIGVPDPRLCDNTVAPPKCFTPPSQFGVLGPAPFTNDDIYEDIQFCATDIDFSTVAASDTVFRADSTGGEGSPGQKKNTITIECPTRGAIKIGGTIGALTCFTTGDDADTEIVAELAGTEVLKLTRPPGGDEYLQGTPAKIDIIQAAEDAGITPKGGDQHELKIIRKRPNCSDLLWGEQEFTLLTATLEWVNPTLEVEVDMPANIDAGQTANVDVRVKVIDQLNKVGFFEGIDVVLNAAGGSLQQLSGQTDSQGYFHTQITADGSAQAVVGQNGATTQNIQVDATATSFEGVSAMGTATASTQQVGYVRLVSVDYYAHVRAGGFAVFEDNDDSFEGTSAGSWQYSANVQADSSHDGKTYDGSAMVNSNINVVVSGDTLTTISGTISGSSQLNASGPFSAVEYPEAIHETVFYVTMEAFDGPVGIEFDATTSAEGQYELELNLGGGGFGYIPNYETPPATFHQYWGTAPGATQMLVVRAYNRSRCTCDRSGSSTINFTIKFGGPPLGGD